MTNSQSAKPRSLFHTLRLALLLSGAIPFAAGHANADFYRYMGKDGVEVYTNIPTSDDAVRVLREREERENERAKSEIRKEKKAPLKVQQTLAVQRRQALDRAAELGKAMQSAPQEPQWPVYTGIVTSRVGWRHDPIDGTIRHHNGVDIAIPVGTSIKAVAAGTVMESGWHGGYGNLVTIDHGDGTFSMYGHNSQLTVKAGDLVQAGQTVALSGSTGRSTGPHLHFEFWRNGSNVTEDYLRKATAVAEVARVVTREVKSYQQKDGSVLATNRY